MENRNGGIGFVGLLTIAFIVLKLILEFEELFDEYVLLVVVGLPITSIPLWDGKPLIGLVSFNIIIFLNIYCVL